MLFPTDGLGSQSRMPNPERDTIKMLATWSLVGGSLAPRGGKKERKLYIGDALSATLMLDPSAADHSPESSKAKTFNSTIPRFVTRSPLLSRPLGPREEPAEVGPNTAKVQKHNKNPNCLWVA